MSVDHAAQVEAQAESAVLVEAEPEQDELAAEPRAAVDDALASTGTDSEDDFFGQLMNRGVWADCPRQSGEDDMVYSVIGEDDQPIASESRRGAERYGIAAVRSLEAQSLRLSSRRSSLPSP